MAVKVQFQIGHTSKLRSKKTVEGFTHDWELYVRGVQQADISTFVDKIIFNLHESFQKPKRICNKPPFVIQESGYAGFIVFIDIYFRNRDEPKKVQFNYDLDLQQTGPPQHRHDIKTFIFDNPSEEFRQKLLKGGGVPVSGVVGGTQTTVNNNIVAMPSAVSLNRSPGDGHKVLMTEGKKHKTRPDDARSNSFANLFGPPITKTSAIVTPAVTKHSPDNKTAAATAATHATSLQPSSGTSLPAVKEKSKDKDKSSEKSKERAEKREKHHKQSLTSPHKEGRSESKKSEGSKHEKRDKTEEKPKKDKNRDKDRERDRDKTSGSNINNNSTNSKRPASPKPIREHSPHKSIAAGIVAANTAVNNTNSVPRPSSSNSGKLEEIKTSTKSSKDSSGESKSKEFKQKDSSSSSSGKKSKKEKKDKDRERDKEKRHEEREKQKLTENQQKSTAKDDSNKITNNISIHSNNTNTQENKNVKSTTNPLNSNVLNEATKKPEKLAKQDLFKTTSDKTSSISHTALAPPAQTTNNLTQSSTEKKSSSSSSLNSNSNPPEKDRRSHKHKKKEKNKDKDKDRERDKEREKDKDKERDKEKEKEKDPKKEKEAKEKHPEEKITQTLSSNQQNMNATKVLLKPAITSTEEQSNSISITEPTSSLTTNAASHTTTTTLITAPSSTLSTLSTKSSKNKDKKSKDKPSAKEDKLKHKSNDMDTSESKAKQAKLSSSNSIHPSSFPSSSTSTSVANAIINASNPTQSVATTVGNIAPEKNGNLDLSNVGTAPAPPLEQVTSLPHDSTAKPSPIITHSDSSNSSFPDLPLPKQPPSSKPATSRERSKSIPAPVVVAPAPILSSAPKEPPKAVKSTAKEKSADKPPKDEEREKKRRRNSQAVNTFIEPPLKQLKTKEQSKSVREKSKSPSLRNTGSRASISAEASTTFLQPSASPSSTAAAAPLPPPSSVPSASHSPALSATEAVGNATSATANAATCNSNSTPSSTTNSTSNAAPHQLPLDYLSELQELHHKIMTLQDNEDLQHVVELIAATGCYEITTKTFDFDLCKLDRSTVQRLQEFFATSVS